MVIGLRAAGLAVLGGVLALSGCQPKVAQMPPQKPPEVLVSKAVLRDVLDFEEFPGRTEAIKTVMIRSRVTGYLNKVMFKDGDEVKEGDALFQIDPRRSQADFDAADASVVQAEARLKRLEDDYRRAQQLVGTKAMSREDYDKIVGDRAEADAALRVAKANRLKARVDLDYCSIKAPISGRISRAFIDAHNLVKADDTMLTSLVATDPIYAYFDVDERTYLRLNRLFQSGAFRTSSEEAPVQIALADEKGYEHKGTLNFIDNQVDAGTGTMRFRCSIPNPKREFSPGLFVRIKLPVGVARSAVLIPEQALGTDQGQKFVYVVDEKNDVVYKSVKAGALEDRWRVILDGINPGDRVIVSGLQRVRPGVRVEPTEDIAPSKAKKAP